MIQYVDRKTGQLCIEKIYGHKALSLLYGDSIFSTLLLPLIARLPFWSLYYGYLQKRPQSRSKIAPFIASYGIDTSEFATQNFASFNDFFIRKLKPSCRPISSAPLVCPADGRYLVYPQFSQFVVKGQSFSLDEFLGDPTLAAHYAKGSMVIARLCPTDYHRFHFPCPATPSSPHLINGSLFSVNPLALRKRLSILSENKRVITRLETPLGTILYIEIGATAVGTIRQTFTPHTPVQKGQEKGYFEFGGSCLALLFEPGRVTFDQDLIANTQKGLETLCQYGTSLGM
jgi:phosphatidylserine decarboxylase